ncbi:hypothetical protein ASD8599_03484 [Ascidiaceihabitans donghaensis]|uniref:Uncharacterized protein n=1 Tax=Ascidiaceihabitans donghaensis TaxID=1510460 RepID=A0A2R8BI37_9RHOB|nr:hypothetical protein ASD8599_03484 [Ascidiaceihabitans donghaensis]
MLAGRQIELCTSKRIRVRDNSALAADETQNVAYFRLKIFVAPLP